MTLVLTTVIVTAGLLLLRSRRPAKLQKVPVRVESRRKK
jgi:hypothetical protein